jgi:hypothetical protein
LAVLEICLDRSGRVFLAARLNICRLRLALLPVNPLRQVIHFFMERTRLDRWVDADSINRRRERFRARRFPTLSTQASSDWISTVLDAGKPAAIGRMGRQECGALAAHLGLRQFYKYTWAAPSYSEAGLPRTGVFPPNDETYWRFSELLLGKLPSFDGWSLGLHVGESEILANRCPQARRLEPRSLEPYLLDAPWTARLAGKRVLIIHPFEPSIRAQHPRRASIWPNRPGVLPDFQLEVARAPWGFVQSGFNDWFAMLDWFEQRVQAVHQRAPFDVALIGCGPAGLPLTAFVKKLGAIGINLGDEVIRPLFGVRAGTKVEPPDVQRFYNDAWVDPQPSEMPELPTGSTPQLFQPRR